MNTHVILTLEAAEWLDEQCLAMRRKAGARVSRSQLLRGIVNGCVCQPDLAHFDTQIWPPCKTNNSRYFLAQLFSVAPAEAEPCAAVFAAR